VPHYRKLSSELSDTPNPCAVQETVDPSISCSLSWPGSYSNSLSSSQFLSTKRALGVARRTGWSRALRCSALRHNVGLHHAVCLGSHEYTYRRQELSCLRLDVVSSGTGSIVWYVTLRLFAPWGWPWCAMWRSRDNLLLSLGIPCASLYLHPRPSPENCSQKNSKLLSHS
jgi:hypothetical protein